MMNIIGVKVIMLRIFLFGVIILSSIMLIVTVFKVIMRNVIMLSVTIPNVAALFHPSSSFFSTKRKI
jgi:hypothetical protein